MSRTTMTALVLGLVGCGEPAPLPSPNLVEVAGGDPLRPWVQVIVGPDGIGIEPEPWLRQIPSRTGLPPPHRVWLGAEPDLSAARKDLVLWLEEADDAAHSRHGRKVTSALGGMNVLVDAEAPGPLVVEGLMLASSTVLTVQIAGRVGDRPRGVLGSAPGTCAPAIAVVLAEDGAAVFAGEQRLGPEGCWLEGDEAAAAAVVVESFLAACRPRWAEVAVAAGRPADDLDCAYASAVWDPDHTDGARLVSVLGALYAVDPRLTVGLPPGRRDGLACDTPARPIASLTDEALDEVCQVEEVRMRVAREGVGGNPALRRVLEGR